VKQLLSDRGVSLIGAGIDEVPHAYKDMHSVMAAQADLVDTLGTFSTCSSSRAPTLFRPIPGASWRPSKAGTLRDERKELQT